jgi:hypothetical protein
MGRLRGITLLVARIAALVFVVLVIVTPLSGIAIADGTSGGFPPPDSTRQPVVQPDPVGNDLIADFRVLMSSPGMLMF